MFNDQINAIILTCNLDININLHLFLSIKLFNCDKKKEFCIKCK